MEMWEELAFGFWLALGGYVFWFIAKAKDYQPLTLDELALTWKLHKHETGCRASCVHDLLVKNDDVVGFRCECGYEFLQKRLITQRPKIFAQPDRLAPLQNTSDTMENLGLVYLNIKNI
jgi:hypothetical protein